MTTLKTIFSIALLAAAFMSTASFAGTATTTTAPAKPKCCMKACSKMGDCCSTDASKKTDCPMEGSCCSK